MSATQPSLRVNVADVLRRPGATRVLAGEFEVAGIGVPLANVTGATTIDVRLEGVLEGVVVAGSIAARATVTCRRCLDEQNRDLEAVVTELFSDDPELLTDDGEVYPVDGVEIDLEQLVRDALFLSLPEAPLLCEGDPATCPKYHELLRAGHIESDTDRVDPRWAPLSGLMSDLDEFGELTKEK